VRIGSLFSGIGGLDLGLEWAGLGRTVWQCEIDPFCRGILARHWPEAERYTDVTTLDAARLPDVDVICGGFPCQDVSSAGRAAGIDGERSGLWYHFARIVEAKRPRIVVVENVASGQGRWLPTVRRDLHVLGYGTRAIALSAADVGAPHLRRRIFVVANTDGRELRIEQQRRPSRRARRVRDEGQAVARAHGADVADTDGEGEPCEQGSRHARGRRPHDSGETRSAPLADAGGERLEESARDDHRLDGVARAERGGRDGEPRCRGRHDAKSAMGRAFDGLSGWLDGGRADALVASPWRDGWEDGTPRVDDRHVPSRLERLKSLGNAVVPQCAEVIGRMIVEGVFDERRE